MAAASCAAMVGQGFKPTAMVLSDISAQTCVRVGTHAHAGEIDRDVLGALIYSDRAARRRLNAATHPAVTLELVKQLAWHWLRCHWLVVTSHTPAPQCY